MAEQNRQTVEPLEGVVQRREPNRFAPGEGGRAKGAVGRKRIFVTVRYVEAMAKDFVEHGASAIEDARKQNPLGYLALIHKLGIIDSKIPETPADNQLTMDWGEPEPPPAPDAPKPFQTHKL